MFNFIKDKFFLFSFSIFNFRNIQIKIYFICVVNYFNLFVMFSSRWQEWFYFFSFWLCFLVFFYFDFGLSEVILFYLQSKVEMIFCQFCVQVKKRYCFCLVFYFLVIFKKSVCFVQLYGFRRKVRGFWSSVILVKFFYFRLDLSKQI